MIKHSLAIVFKKLKIWLLKNPGLLIVSATYLFTFLYMLPLRDQTFQDDFAYHLTSKRFYETGIMKLSDWGSASLVSQIYWTSLFTKIIGFSLRNNQLSTISIFFIAIIAFYFLLKRLTDEKRAIIFSITLFTFPWIFQFTYSYLTDIFFTSFMLISLFFYTKAIQDNKNLSYLFGSFFAGTAFLSRQTGIVVPISLCLILIYKSLINHKLEYKPLIFGLFPFVTVLIFYQHWQKIPENLTNAQFQVIDSFKNQVLPYLFVSVLGNTGTTFGYYATYLQRILLYFHHSIGFLLPFLLIFKFKLTTVINLFKKYRKGIIFLTLIYIFIYCVNYFYHFALPSYTIEVPTLITRYDSVSLINWNLYWKYFVFISVPFWLVIFGVISEKIFNKIFKRKVIINKSLFLFITTMVILLLLLLQTAIFKISFKHYIPTHYYLDELTVLRMYLKIVFSSHGTSVIKYTWLIIFIIFTFLTVPTYILTHYTFKKIQHNYESLFLMLVFTFQFLIIVVFMYFHWAQYIIPFVPFLLIVLAMFSKKYLPISNYRAVIFLLLLIIFSINLTNNRYQSYGISWEMANKLIKNGVEPIDIDFPEESWLPYWYFEQTFRKKAEELGSKYLIKPAQWATWRNVISKSNYVYSFYDVPSDFKYEDEPSWEIVDDSGIQKSGFFIKRRIVTVKINKLLH